jgi:hypothetical protein
LKFQGKDFKYIARNPLAGVSEKMANGNIAIDDFKLFQSNVEWFFANYDKFKEDYRGKYVLVDNNEILLADKDLKELEVKAKQEKMDLTTKLIEFVPVKDLLLIF